MKKLLASAALIGAVATPTFAEQHPQDKYKYRIEIWPAVAPAAGGDTFYCKKFSFDDIHEDEMHVRLEDCATYQNNTRRGILDKVPYKEFVLENGKVFDVYIQKTNESVLTVDKRKLGRDKPCYPNCKE